MASRFGPSAQQASLRTGYMRIGNPNGGLGPNSSSGGAVTPSTAHSFGSSYSSQATATPTTQHAPARQGSGGKGKIRRLGSKEAKEVAWVHFRALRDFLDARKEEETRTARASARAKLEKLNPLQFLELSTDVYDELMRRLSVQNGANDGSMHLPFLPVDEDFHPKRNQARQKLATLPDTRFKDLASDVYFELRRRYPDFGEDTARTESQHSYDEQYSGGPATSPVAYSQGRSTPSGREGTGSAPSTGPRPTHNRKGSSMGSSAERSAVMGSPMLGGSRDRLANLTMPTNDVVVPNKSRLQEEAIEVPYARDSTEVAAGSGLPRDGSFNNFNNGIGQHQRGGSLNDDGPSGMRHLRSDSRTSERGPSTVNSHDPTTEDGYMDHMSFASTARSQGQTRAAGQSWGEQEEQLRSGYELRIAGIQRQLQRAEGERDELQRAIEEERERRKDFEDEVRGLKERATTHASSLRSVQHELEMARDSADAERSRNEQTARQAQEEIAQWRERCDGLEDELRRLEEERADNATRTARGMGVATSGGDNEEGMASLQSEVRSLVDELQSLSRQNEELVSERERERDEHAALTSKVDEYKRQATALRTELRNLKATSTLFIAKPLTDDHLPASADGNIEDVNVSKFQSAIDDLLAVARSSQPSRVLPAMKGVVEASQNIGENIEAFEKSPNLDVDASRLESLKHESSVRLAGLMSAARNHAMAAGLSPVSLIDAAAGHLSANVVEIIKLLKIRRSGSTRDILRKRPSMSIGEMVRRNSGRIAEDEEEDLDDGYRPLLDAGAPAPAPAPPPSSFPVAAQAQRGLTPGGYDNPEIRIKSFQSASSTAQRSDSFDLERKVSVASTIRSNSEREPLVQPRDPRERDQREHREQREPQREHYDPFARGDPGEYRQDYRSEYRQPNQNQTQTQGQYRQEYDRPEYRDTTPTPAAGPSPPRQRDDNQEWLEVKHRLDPQSSALVKSIQSILDVIRRGGPGDELSEHLSDIIAASASIVAASRGALPQRLKTSGEPLLGDMVANTDRLSQAQQAGKGGFDKDLRKGIASASFGVAKALKALMKLGVE